jgi:hypothetical protein
MRRVAILLILLAACAPDNDKPPAPKPEPGEEARPPAPAPPQGTDFGRPGEHGRVGVDPPGDDKPNTDVPITESEDAGGILGSSWAEQRYWDQVHPFKECPVEPIYVYASSVAPSVPQCTDGQGYAGVCNACEQDAYRRAVNVIRSCERAPGCRGAITQVAQRWSCNGVRPYLGEDPKGQPIYGKTRWEKECWTQYKVVCIQS